MRLTKQIGQIDAGKPYMVLADETKPWIEAYQEALKKLASYEDAEEQGRLLVLPCKVGDMVYRVQYIPDKTSLPGYRLGVACIEFYLFLLEEYGKTLFTTRAEAEKALMEFEREFITCRECAVPHNKWTGCPKLNGLVTPPDYRCGFGKRAGKKE